MEEHEEKPKKKEITLKINKRFILWVIIAILSVAVIYVVFFKDATVAQAVTSASQTARSSSSGMVGGC